MVIHCLQEELLNSCIPNDLVEEIKDLSKKMRNSQTSPFHDLYVQQHSEVRWVSPLKLAASAGNWQVCQLLESTYLMFQIHGVKWHPNKSWIDPRWGSICYYDNWSRCQWKFTFNQISNSLIILLWQIWFKISDLSISVLACLWLDFPDFSLNFTSLYIWSFQVKGWRSLNWVKVYKGQLFFLSKVKAVCHLWGQRVLQTCFKLGKHFHIIVELYV